MVRASRGRGRHDARRSDTRFVTIAAPMALWKTQPTLRLFVPQPIRVGEPFVATLEIEAREPVPVEWVDLTLECVEGWSVGAGKNRVSRVHRYPKIGARLVEETELSGTTRHQASFTIPFDEPPSQHGGAAYVRHTFQAQASIPWWPDARASWPLSVRAAVVPATPSPVVVQTDASDLIEVSLESQRVASQGIVGGLVALKKTLDTPLVVDIALREVLTLVSWNGYERVRHGRGFTTSVTLSPALGGQAPFRFRFEDAAPSFSAETFRHRWELVLTPRTGGLFSFFSSNALSVPIEMVESTQLAAASETLVAPSVGEARLGELVQAAQRARPAWSIDGLRLERSVESPFGPIDARLEWASRENGTFLRATIEPPRLGLGLRVASATILDRLAGDTSVGVAAWDPQHDVAGREAAQIRAFLAPLALVSGGLSMSATDDAIELERRDPTMDHTSLTQFVDEIDAVLSELPGALAAIPPPSGTSVDRTEAIRLARLSRGTFHPGDLALRGAIDDRSFEAGLVFEGARPVVLRVTVTSLPEGSLHVGPSREAEALAALPEAVRALVASLPVGVTISIDGGRGHAVVAAPATPLFGVDHERSIALAGTVVALSRALSPDRGPFR
jgi:hypothetical protein